MNLDIAMKKSAKRSFIEAASRFFIHELKLKNSKYTLTVFTKKGLSKTDAMSGMTTELPDKQIVIVLDSNLTWEKTLTTLAHEMVHVKQIATGRLKYKVVRGKSQAYWLGKRVVKEYTERPWEIQAWSQELLLANKLMAIMSQNHKS